jgi:hypothetical protein
MDEFFSLKLIRRKKWRQHTLYTLTFLSLQFSAGNQPHQCSSTRFIRKKKFLRATIHKPHAWSYHNNFKHMKSEGELWATARRFTLTSKIVRWVRMLGWGFSLNPHTHTHYHRVTKVYRMIASSHCAILFYDVILLQYSVSPSVGAIFILFYFFIKNKTD